LGKNYKFPFLQMYDLVYIFLEVGANLWRFSTCCSEHCTYNIQPNTSKVAILRSGGQSYSDMCVEDFMDCMLTSSAPQEIRSGRETKTSIVLSLIAGISIPRAFMCSCS
jgi:hypothetical protein